MAHAAPNKSAEEIAEARRKAHQLCQAYLVVFGSSEARTDAQKLVMKDLEHRGYLHRPIFVRDEQGDISATRAAFADGMRSMVLQIQEFIRSALASDDPQPKPKSIRT
jgi:hypothetical protein